MIGELHGPISARRNDIFVPRDSELESRFAEFVHDSGEYCIFGDAIFPVLKYIRRRPDASPQWASVRVCVEWSYSKIVSLWRFLDFKQNLKLGENPVPQMFFVAALLTNFNTCFYGSQTGSYFDLEPPSIEDYLSFSNE